MKNLFKVSAVVLGLGLGFSQTASAKIDTIDVSSGLFSASPIAGSFDDYWTFNLAAPSDLLSETTNFAVSFGMIDFWDISNLSASLYKASLGSTVTNPLSYASVTGDLNASATDLSFLGLGSGDYAIKISGLGVGFGGGHYEANLNITEATAPVPEPEEWAMMLLGLPLMGFVARHKKSDNNSNFVNAVVA